MQINVKLVWMIATALNAIALLYFWIGSTAFFNRAPGTSWGFYFMFIGLPVAVLIVISIICFIVGWMPRSDSSLSLMILVILFISFMVIFMAPLPIEQEGWVTEQVDTIGFMQTTDDGKYEYTLEIVNSFQNNSQARLFVKDISTGEETRIPLDMANERITINLSRSINEDRAWAHLVPSEVSPSIYLLTTTEYLNNQIEVFEICMETRTSRRIE